MKQIFYAHKPFPVSLTILKIIVKNNFYSVALLYSEVMFPLELILPQLVHSTGERQKYYYVLTFSNLYG
jgi:hypothetical protein